MISRQRKHQIKKKKRVDDTVKEMISLGFDYYSINEYCQEMFGKQYYTLLKRKSNVMREYIFNWIIIEQLPCKIPPYYNPQDNNK